MPYTNNRILFLVLLAACSIIFCVWRDIQLEKQYTGDLRNRIVGARLQKDGVAPYFYKWKSADSIRYYDPQNFDSFKVSNITATPFTHQLLSPIADMQQRSVSRLWLLGEYMLLFGASLLAIVIAKSTIQQWAVLIMANIFAYTSIWENHIAAGQYYLVIPALCMIFYYLIRNKKNLLWLFLAGLITASLILIRPNTVVFFLTFLLLPAALKTRRSLLFACGMIFVFLFSFAGSDKLKYWNNFREAMNEQVKAHQALGPTIQQNEPDPGLIKWEGWDKEQIQREAKLHPFTIDSEHGNVFAIVNHITGKRMPVWMLTALSVLSIGILFFFFYKRRKAERNFSFFTTALLASCLYMIPDLCSPFYRYPYNGVQWLFPLLLIAAHYKRQYKKIYTLILVGLLLNVIDIPGVPFEHTAGEYIIFVGVIVLTFSYRSATVDKRNSGKMTIKTTANL